MKKETKSLAINLIRTKRVQLIIVAGLLSILGYSVGRNIIIKQKESHRAHLPVALVSERLISKISFPTIINQLNEKAIAADPGLLKVFDKFSLRFWRQLRSFPVDYINYGSEDGSFLGIKKSQDGSLFHNGDSSRLRWGKEFGLDWLLPTGTSAGQEVSMAERSLTSIICISIAVLLIALAIIRRLINSLLTSLRALNSATENTEKQIRDANEQPEVISFNCDIQELESGAIEIRDLHQTITAMVTAFNNLTQNLKEKEKQIRKLFQDKQKEDKQALAMMSKKLKTSLEAVSISHEIKQPLSILKLTSQILISHIDANSESTNMTELKGQLLIINSQSERIIQITDKVRALLRNAQTDLTVLDLKQVIENSLYYVNAYSIDRHNWINSQQIDSIVDSSALINGDAVQLQIAIINILKNSIESLRESGNPDPLILVRLKDNENSWIIEIEDNGGGLLPEMNEESVMKSSKPDGTGLGLFIVRTAIENHNGNLSLQNTSSGGVLVQLSLPKATEIPSTQSWVLQEGYNLT